MKKATIIFSFFLISVFSIGSYFLHKLYLQNYKKEFKAYIKHSRQNASFTTISINPSELYANSINVIWEDENKEVVYKGILYDVVSIKGKGLTVELTMISDNQEMALKKQFAYVYDINSHSKTKGPFELLKNFFTLKYVVNNSVIEFNNSVMENNSPNTDFAFQITAIVIHQETPPPDFYS